MTFAEKIEPTLMVKKLDHELVGFKAARQALGPQQFNYLSDRMDGVLDQRLSLMYLSGWESPWTPEALAS